MSLNAFDATDALSVASHADDIKAAGYEAVCLYYFRQSNFKQLLTRHVAEAVAAAGLKLFSVYENGSPISADYFTVATANLDGHTAGVRALDAGQPSGGIVYFAVDYDCDPADLPAITAYFTEVRRVLLSLTPSYHCGVYGSGLVCRHLSELGLVSKTWLSQSKSFDGYSDWLQHADIVQGVETQVLSLDVDLDTVNPDAGLWVPV
jgi:hypothetical protein